MKKLLFLLFAGMGYAQTTPGQLTLVAPTNPRAGATAVWNVTLSGGSIPSMLQWTFGCDHTLGTVSVAATGTALAATKNASYVGTTGTTIIAGFNQYAIADGTIASISVTLPIALANVNLSCSLIGGILPALGVSATALPIVETPNPIVSVLILPSLSPCDLNADGRTDSVDVALERTAVQNQSIVGDRNGDGAANVVDLQIVTNAALGFACTATQ